MDTLQQLREKLRDANKAKIARETGLHYNTVLKVLTRDHNTTYGTLQKLQQYAATEEG